MLLDFKEGTAGAELIRTLGITKEHLTQAQKLHGSNKLGVLENLKKMGVINDNQAVDLEAQLMGVKLVNLKNHIVSPEVANLLGEEIRSKYQVLPLSKNGNIVTLATTSLLNIRSVFNDIQKALNAHVNLVLAYPAELTEKLGEFSKNQANMDDLLEGKAKELSLTQDSVFKKMIEDPNGPVAKVISHLLNQAVTTGASDIHFEPLPQLLRIRFREDGVLREVKTFDKLFVPAFSAAIKVMASMDIAETRLPQDGSMSMTISGRKIDFRVASYPMEHGEKLVLRILDSNKDWVSIDALNLSEKVKNRLIELIEAPQGLILCAGPTGSGKTSTLYSIIKHLNTVRENILTIEDPIEFRLSGVNQGQVNVKKGFTFATGLRAMLRLDPNVILVGEMRDRETAEIGAQAALTGHLVLSSIHANSSTQTMARLIDMGVEKFVVGSALNGVISQRLLRRICSKCKTGYKPTESELVDVGFTVPPKELFKGRGCHHCHQEGYKGRIPVLELLIIHNDMRNIISKDANPGELYQAAIHHGMWTIYEDAREKICQGLTTTDEAFRVLGRAPPGAQASLKVVQNTG